MFRDVIRPETTQAEWNTIREDIHTRILDSMGRFPEVVFKPRMEYLQESHYQDLRIQHICFTTIPEFKTYGTLVLPATLDPETKRSAVLCIHGTDQKLAHRNVISPKEKPNRQYAIELAQRGLIAFAVLSRQSASVDLPWSM